ncbi:MAG: hypothetical protein VX871_07240 [Pseudomonadota bacterium]|nr:hypothetical protein [Pseudomonadota bacterium]
MLKNVVLVAAAVTVASGVAFARDLPTNEAECTRLQEVTRTVVTGIKLNETQVSEVDGMMKTLAEQCTAAQYEAAQTTAEKVIAKVSAE